MWAPRALDLHQLREIPGLEELENRACTTAHAHVHPNLTHISRAMEPAIEEVGPGVYNAVGFDVANTTFVIGRDGVVVIDAMTSAEDMARALLAFREICEYPVVGVLYSHSHGDHWGGSPGLGLDPEEVAAGRIPVIAQRMLPAEIARINGFNQAIMAARSAYQFGAYLPATVDGRVNIGAGPFLDFSQRAGLVPPNLFVDERLEIEIAGVPLEITWVPSEAPDEIVTWLPEQGVLQTAECVQGECYPNVYTLRGDVPRPAATWVASLDVLRRFPAEALAKSHGRSVVGAEDARYHLRNYRDAIAWTHDQTVRQMNKGYVPDQIVERLGDMPPHLRADETAGIEGYGTVSHASRSIYTWYLGFNTGEVTDFDPAPYDRRQRGYVSAMGGAAQVKELARQAIADGDDRWAIELLGHLVRSEPDDTEARQLSAEAHRRLGWACENATWRNWYLSAAAELEGTIPIGRIAANRDILMGLPLDSVMRGLPVRLRAELTWYVELRVAFEVGGDAGGAFVLWLRRGVLEVLPTADAAATDEGARAIDATARFADKAALVEYLVGADPAALEAGGRLTVEGDRDSLVAFGGYFDEPPVPTAIHVTFHGPTEERTSPA